jgi:hypothetical protein
MISKNSFRILIVAMTTLMIVTTVNGFSSGAAGCGPAPSVGGAHLDNSGGKTVQILEFNSDVTTRPITLYIDNKIIPVNGTAIIKSGTSVDITLNGTLIKGVLVRLSSTSGIDLTGTILPKLHTKVAGACSILSTTVTGITHIAANDKPEIRGTIKFPPSIVKRTTVLDLDITVVFFNSDTRSIFTYGKFQIQINPCTKRRICRRGIGGILDSIFNRCKQVCDCENR